MSIVKRCCIQGRFLSQVRQTPEWGIFVPDGKNVCYSSLHVESFHAVGAFGAVYEGFVASAANPADPVSPRCCRVYSQR